MAPPPNPVDPASTWNRPRRRSARMDFGASIGSPRATRVFVGDTARSWGLGDVGSLAELLVSELVTNAVEHGSSGGTVELEALPAGLRVAVTDHAPGRPEVQHPDVDEPTGRGLAIVDRLSRWWGVEAVQGGKTVWFEVDDVDVTKRW